ncbi:DUF3303 family protein [Actinospica sp.]|jgi:hypothetical protein|uniref:DUF3303 family protein n=1 Tax=Actinospica sp. TaxID=1872142 RepID=UPI002C88B7E3|nr:DUF3303 family protein [Actinospica sp.]HWG24612.1 DUF3303 family protein [Actinospica sp.]
MRVLMTVSMDTEKANLAIRNNKLAEIMTSSLEAVKPEATYFGTKDGLRTGYIVFDLVDASDIPSIAEPFFQELDAKIDVIPVMDLADVQAGLQKYSAR